ncbi:acetate/propionate family kinase [Leptothrix discophora]|uniref:Acetate kinase n=1 Tax=Leptothrix discophora TaxID=89 RepID=A0ABT9G0E9_LEPDI|nr:acetate/propionate family kinase [Leptothrix discophora]MDP4299777.1 acetate/propionate family kinase [Leptothrix discophora]
MPTVESAPAAASGAPQPAVLVVNAGSSSLKFALYPRGDASGLHDRSPAFARGQIDGLQPGGSARLSIEGQPARPIEMDGDDSRHHDTALRAMQDHLAARAPTVQVVAVAHRIVHGGPHFRAPVVLDDAVLAMLGTLEPLAPLHQPHNLAGVRALRRAWPGLPQIGCFDTAFHASLPKLEQRYALPADLHEQGLRRYGFHGLSYQFVMQALQRRSERASGRVLMAHLGSGASLCAASGGLSVASSMGFSALDGLMMGSRCGQLDPGIVLHLWRQGWTLAQVENLLYRESGLRGVSGLSGDLRELRRATAEGHAAAQSAIDLFDYRLRREAGALGAVLGGIDLIAFTGGIGEHDAQTRAELVHGLAHLDVQLDNAANEAARGDRVMAVHLPGSRVEVWVVPTDEGRVAADAAWTLLDRATPTPRRPPV